METAANSSNVMSESRSYRYIAYIFIITYLVFRPYYLTKISIISTLTSCMTVVIGTGYICHILIAVFKKGRVNAFVTLIYVYYTWYYVSAAINGTQLDARHLMNLILGIARLSILIFSIKNAHLHNRAKEFYIGTMFAFFSMLVINMITMIANPAGLVQIYVYGNNTPTAMYFLGNDNGFWYYLVVAVTVSLMYISVIQKKSKLIFAFCVIVALITPLITRSMTSSIGVICMVVLMGIDLFKHEFLQGRLFKARTFLMIIVILNCAFLLFDPVKLFSGILYKLFGKTASFVARVNIWETVKHLIAEHPVIGHGLASESNYVLTYSTGHSVSAHNDVLQILYYGGLIGFIFLILLLFRSYKGIDKEHYNNYGFFACLGLFAYGIAALTEVPSNDFALIFLMCILYYSRFINISQNKSDEFAVKD